MTIQLVLKILILSILSSTVTNGQTVSEIIALIREGKIEQAQSLLSRMETSQKLIDQSLFLHGLLSTEGNVAASYYEQLVKTYPESRYSDYALFRLAQLQYAQGLYHSAQNRFAKILSDYPQSPIQENCNYWIELCRQAAGQADSTTVGLPKNSDQGLPAENTDSMQTGRDSSEKTWSEKLTDSPAQSAFRYSVQVGAFSNQSNAILRKAFFEKENYEVKLRTKKKDGTILYLIWVGTCDSQEKARNLGEELKKRFGVNYTVISE